jgi:hypothetical protein
VRGFQRLMRALWEAHGLPHARARPHDRPAAAAERRIAREPARAWHVLLADSDPPTEAGPHPADPPAEGGRPAGARGGRDGPAGGRRGGGRGRAGAARR